ncbi:hypothetical protein EVU94_14605 [Flavobacteriaceae bacterium 144Ye]|uniref:hypothetical protein n=1 Tax=Gaetbulibacter jejuensis TaxID=584607 RepID=UPI0010D9AA6C|nr:hypothetical protein EVU94_14605 [Flavobacteriaceae bacterium 144Ye]
MTEIQVKLLFRRFAVINLLMSLLLLFLYEKLELSERISAFMVINIGYFMFYFFLSRGLTIQFKWIKKNSKSSIFKFQIKMIMLFTVFIKICAVIFLLALILKAIATKEFYSVSAVCVPISVYLGGTLAGLNIQRIE